MADVTYGAARSPATSAVERVQTKPRKGLFARFMGALRESRRREARSVIERHAHLLLPDDS